MEKVSSKKIPYHNVGRRAGDLASCVAKNRRAGDELGWQPERSLDVCAKDLYNYLVLNGMMKGQSRKSNAERMVHHSNNGLQMSSGING